jgi:hypothetical protein
VFSADHNLPGGHYKTYYFIQQHKIEEAGAILGFRHGVNEIFAVLDW